MIITITPEDLIKRCIWNNYKKFILKDYSEKDIEKIISDNEPFSLKEDDAYVIGLLKVVKTDNLIHRFKEVINEVINIKSTIQKVDNSKKVLINKSSLLKECLSFKNHFPVYYNSDENFLIKINEVNKYINKKVKEIDNLEIIELEKIIKNKKKKITYLHSSKVSKLFKLNTIID
jgi:hypothetical protein